MGKMDWNKLFQTLGFLALVLIPVYLVYRLIKALID